MDWLRCFIIGYVSWEFCFDVEFGYVLVGIILWVCCDGMIRVKVDFINWKVFRDVKFDCF